MWRTLLGSSSSGVAWTVEEHAAFAARRDYELLKLLSNDRKAFATAMRLRWASPAVTANADNAGPGQREPRRTASAATSAHAAANGSSSARRDSSACPAGEQAVDRPPRVPAAVDGSAVRVPAGRFARRPRCRSEAALAAREAAFEQKRLRRKLLAVLPLVGQWAQRQLVGNGLPTPGVTWVRVPAPCEQVVARIFLLLH